MSYFHFLIITERRKCSNSGRKKTKKCLEESTSSDSDNILSKKIKLDLDFTPRKYVEAKEQLAVHQSTNKRIYNLNLGLQEKVLSLEKKIAMLEKKVLQQQKHIIELEKGKNISSKLSDIVAFM